MLCTLLRTAPEGKQCPYMGVWGTASERPAVESRRGMWEGDQDPHIWGKASPADPGSRICIYRLPTCNNINYHQALSFAQKEYATVLGQFYLQL